MRFSVLTISLLLLSVVRLSACEPGTTDTSDADLAAQIKAVNDKIEELRAKQSALVQEQQVREEQKAAKQRQEELARQQKEEAERKLHFAKVEIRGKLIMTQQVQPYTSGITQTSAPLPTTDWYINIGQLAWKLKLPDNAELLARAQKLVGKSVIVTGTVVLVKNQTAPTYPQPYPVYPYAPGHPVVPTPSQQPSIDPGFTPLQYPNGGVAPPGGVYPSPQLTYVVPMEEQVTINVETLKAAE
jgi:hypothetical protein